MPELHHFEYQLQAGQYHLYDLRDAPSAVTGQRRWRLQVDVVALAFDESTGELLEHGRPERVWSWAATRRRQMRMARQWDRAAALIVISGPFPVAELNRCLKEAGYVAKLFKRLATLPNGKSAYIRPPAATSASSGASFGAKTGFGQKSNFGAAGFGQTRTSSATAGRSATGFGNAAANGSKTAGFSTKATTASAHKANTTNKPTSSWQYARPTAAAA